MENQETNSVEQKGGNLSQPSSTNNFFKLYGIHSSFGVALLMFLLPFCVFKCGGIEVVTLSGIDLVTGTELKVQKNIDRAFSSLNDKKYKREKNDETNSENTAKNEIPSNHWAIIAFVSGIIGLASAFLIREHKLKSVIGVGTGLLAALSLVLLQITFTEEFKEKVKEPVVILEFGIAYWLSLIAFVVAASLSFQSMKRKRSITSNL